MLAREAGKPDLLELTELRVVHSMHERKQTMSDLSDGFAALPGGMGTFEELCEILTWAQLGIHSKPIGLVNANGYYEPLLTLFDHAVNEGFISPTNRALLKSADTPSELLDTLGFLVEPSTLTDRVRLGGIHRLVTPEERRWDDHRKSYCSAESEERLERHELGDNTPGGRSDRDDSEHDDAMCGHDPAQQARRSDQLTERDPNDVQDHDSDAGQHHCKRDDDDVAG